MKKFLILLCTTCILLCFFCGCVVKDTAQKAGDITVYTKQNATAQNKVTLSAEDSAKIRGFIEKTSYTDALCLCDETYFIIIDGVEYHCSEDASHLTDYKNKKCIVFDNETTGYLRGILMSYPDLGYVYEAGE